MTRSAKPGAGFSMDSHEIAGVRGPIPIRDYRPDNRTARTSLLWVHGGGFAFGSIDMKESDAPARQLAASGTFVRTVDYRLAPKMRLFGEPNLAERPGRFPAGLDDVVTAATSLAELDGAAINIGGASAGANLAASASIRLRDAHVLPRSLVLAYGAFHTATPTGTTIESELRGPLARWAFNADIYRRIALNYVGDPSLVVPSLAFPGGLDLAGLPPTLSVNASNDRLRATGHVFADELRSVGVPVEESIVKGMHGFLGTPRKESYLEGMRLIAAWLAEHD